MNNLKQIPGMDLQQETLRAVSVLSPCNNPNPGLIIMREVWKDVIDYEGLYRISNLGGVRSCNKIRYQYNPNVSRIISATLTGKLMRSHPNKRGYLSIKLRKNGKCNFHSIHRLVAKAFIPNPENKPNINHIDFNQLNNNKDNLEWCTQRENVQHAIMHDRRNTPKGEDNKSSKLKSDDIPIIRRMVGSGIPQNKVAQIYNVSAVTILKIYRREKWKHIL